MDDLVSNKNLMDFEHVEDNVTDDGQTAPPTSSAASATGLKEPLAPTLFDAPVGADVGTDYFSNGKPENIPTETTAPNVEFMMHQASDEVISATRPNDIPLPVGLDLKPADTSVTIAELTAALEANKVSDDDACSPAKMVNVDFDFAKGAQATSCVAEQTLTSAMEPSLSEDTKVVIVSHSGEHPLMKTADENGATYAVKDVEKVTHIAAAAAPSTAELGEAKKVAAKTKATAHKESESKVSSQKPTAAPKGNQEKATTKSGTPNRQAPAKQAAPRLSREAKKPTPTATAAAGDAKSPAKVPKTTPSAANGKPTAKPRQTAAPRSASTSRPVGNISHTSPATTKVMAKEKLAVSTPSAVQKSHLKNAQAKVGSLDNVKHKPAAAAPRLHTTVVVQSRKLDFNKSAKSKIGSLENIKYKPAGGHVKIFEQKLNFKNKASSKVAQEVSTPDNKLPVEQAGVNEADKVAAEKTIS